MHAWKGEIIRVDLTRGSIKKEPLNMSWAKAFIGARGLGVRYMFEEVDPRVDPLSPDNKLIIGSGPLTGTYAPSGGRYTIVTKSPLTGTIASANSGGSFGPELKFAGYDMIIIEGKAAKPVYLSIHNDQVALHDARHLWGKDVHETTDMLLEGADPSARVACIGPAGEKMAHIACVMNDYHRAAGRGGTGAVMGSKNLKAIIVRGTGAVTVADVEGFRGAATLAHDTIMAHPVGGTGLRLYGTNVLTNILNEIGGYPTRNFQEGHFPTADKVSGETVAATQLQRPRGCFACTISCGRGTKVTNPKYRGEGEGPEYESAWGFGGDCGIDDIDAVTKANYWCNELGMDTISASATIACAMELFEKGAITLDDTGGLDLSFGNAEAMVEATRLTGLVEGFGAKLAQGSKRLAAEYGHPDLSMSVKGQEIPAYDPRAVQGIGLNYATSNCGAAHVRGYTISPEVLGVPEKVDKDAVDGKPELVIVFQNLTAFIDSSGACLFTTFGIGGEEYAAMFASATGIPFTVEDVMRAGDRIWNLERIWNNSSGFGPDDDTLPPRLLNEPLPAGNSKGALSRLNEMMPIYYERRGWSPDGAPTAEKMDELGLSATVA